VIGSVGSPFRNLLLVSVGATVLLAGGCDTGGSKPDSLYQKLIGSWRVNTVSSGENSPSPLIDTVRIEFSRENAVRSYRIIQDHSSDTTRVGRVFIPKSNVLRMGGYRTPLVWTFKFDGSRSVQLQLSRAGDTAVQEFLADIGQGGGARRLTLELLRDSG